jgi:hypothetical protein
MSNPPESLSVPDGAIEYARAALKLGISVPEIEKRLVEKGLTPALATAVVNGLLTAQTKERFEPLPDSEGGDLIHRLMSIIVTGVCLILAYKYNEGLSVGLTLIWILGPLACIWFPDHLTTHPPEGLRALGWLILILIGVYRVVMLVVFS